MSLFALLESPDPFRRSRVVRPPYDAMGQGPRAAAWTTSDDAINSILQGGLPELRARSRDQVRMSPWIGAGVRHLVAHIVGRGIRPRPLVKDKALRRAMLELWQDWTEEAVDDEQLGFYGAQELAVRGMVESGETFVRMRGRRLTDGLPVPLQLQVLESDHVPVHLNRTLPNGNRIRFGIEFNPIGRRVAYWMHREHPGESTSSAGVIDTTRVPASEVIHLYAPLRPGQVRGLPWAAGVLGKSYELDQFQDGELKRQSTASLFAGFVKVPGEEEDGEEFLPTTSLEGVTADPGQAFARMTPGDLFKLLPGEEISFARGAEIASAYEAFMRVNLRGLAAGLGPLYEMLTGDLSGVTFTSLRFGMLNFRAWIMQLQQNLVCYQLCRKLWRRWFAAAVLAGRIDVRITQEALAEARRVRWVAPGFQWIDPQKEINAAVRAIRSGLSTQTEELAGLGRTIEDVMHERAEEMELADELGLVLDIDGRRLTNAGVAQSNDPSAIGTPGAMPPGAGGVPIDPPPPDPGDDDDDEEDDDAAAA